MRTQIFVSYAREDSRWLQEDSLIPWLARSLKKDGVDLWWDREGILPGDEFRELIEKKIDESAVAILLVSQEFLNSEFIEHVELRRIETRANLGELVAIPILLEPCGWDELQFLSNRQMLPGKATPLINYLANERDWVNVRAEILDGIRRKVSRLRNATARNDAKGEPQGDARKSDDQQRKLESTKVIRRSKKSAIVALAAIVVGVAAMILVANWPRPRNSETMTPIANTRAESSQAVAPVEPGTIRSLEGHREPISSLAISPDGSTLFSAGGGPASQAGEIYVWDLRTATLKRTQTAHGKSVDALAVSSDGALLASGGADDLVNLWDVRQWMRTSEFKASGDVKALAFVHRGQLLAAGDITGTVRIWDVKRGTLQTTLRGDPNTVWSLAFSPNGEFLASASDDRSVRIWRVMSGESYQILGGYRGGVYSVAFSPDGRSLATVAAIYIDTAIGLSVSGGEFRLWDTRSWELRRTISIGSHSGLAFSPDGSLLAVADQASVRLLKSDASLHRVLEGSLTGLDSFGAVAFSPDGRRVVAGTNQRIIQLLPVSK
jgi:WD40 repeat protein